MLINPAFCKKLVNPILLQIVAFFSTITTYIGGILLSLLLNNKKTKLPTLHHPLLHSLADLLEYSLKHQLQLTFDKEQNFGG